MKFVIPILMSIVLGSVIFLGFVVVKSTATKPICFVRMPEIMDKYQGAVDAGVLMRKRQELAQANVDSLVRQLEGGVSPMTLQEKSTHIDQYMNAIERKEEEAKAEISKQLISQVRTAAESVAEDQDAELVLAITDESFVLYNAQAIDITGLVLTSLRKNYRSEMRK